MTVKAYGAHAGDQPLESLDITRRAPGAHDVQIAIAYCGVCHSDVHQVRSEWAGTLYPCVPGHEIVGRVSAVGAQVSGVHVGDLVGVGCQHCAECGEGLENYCDHMVGTYNGPTADAPGHTLGGYSQQIVVHERYVLHIRHPEAQLAAVAPLLCAVSGGGAHPRWFWSLNFTLRVPALQMHHAISIESGWSPCRSIIVCYDFYILTSGAPPREKPLSQGLRNIGA